MKLLWVCYSRMLEGHWHLAGSERIERLSYLSREGVEAFLLAGDFQRRNYKKYENLHLVSIPLRYVPIITPVLYGLALFFFLPFYVLKIRPDFIISDPSTTPFLIWKPFLSKLVNFKMVLDIRSTPVSSLRTRLAQAHFNLAVWTAKTMFDGMTIVTPMMKKEICRIFALRSDWVSVLPNGISDDFLKYRKKECDVRGLREKLGLSNKFVIIYHGSIRDNGGLLESIEAVGLTKNARAHPDIVLFLLGAMPPQFLSVLKKAIETNGVQNNVILHGPVDFHSVPNYISVSDVGLVPLPNVRIWRYQQPLKLLEYMAMGKTIIATDSPAHRSVAGDNNNVVYVPDLNPNSLAKAMIYAYENRNNLDDWGRVGKQVIAEKYVWKKVNEDLIGYLMRIRLGEGCEQGIPGARDNQHSLMTALHAARREKWLGRVSENERREIQEQRRRSLERLAIISQFCHLVSFTLKRPRTQLECGALVTSIDVDVGSRRVGERNKGKNDCHVHGYLSEQYIGKLEEEIIPMLSRFFDDLAIPVTFAIRGQLVEVENSILEPILNSSIEHEIAAHGYFHRTFTSLSRAEAQNELEMISTGFQKFGVRPTSFVFPNNCVNHLDLLERSGYVSYRDEGGLRRDGMFIRRKGQLYDVHPGFGLGFTYNPIFLNKIIDIAATHRLPFHIWFHPRDIFETRGSTQKNIERVLLPLYNYAKQKEKEGTLKFETMQSITNKVKKIM